MCIRDRHGAALSGMVKLVGQVAEDMHANGEVLPVPLSQKPYSGKFQLRIPPEKHRSLAITAAEQGVSLNRYIAGQL